ncbi:hypothetical protein LY76DRAFT_189275 [Colletotrichum caudatum]|nr:hypothetical protein LY76DRAFT_189275 [Colletotrichum caudatum]
MGVVFRRRVFFFCPTMGKTGAVLGIPQGASATPFGKAPPPLYYCSNVTPPSHRHPRQKSSRSIHLSVHLEGVFFFFYRWQRIRSSMTWKGLEDTIPVESCTDFSFHIFSLQFF